MEDSTAPDLDNASGGNIKSHKNLLVLASQGLFIYKWRIYEK